jgi:cyclopropane fatty-acyl-phospholipid synthase-like methyltransferase
MLRCPRPMSYHSVHLPQDPARDMVWRVVADHLSHWIPPGAHVLEIGAGYCSWINAVRAARRVAADIWPEVGRHAAAGVEARVLDVRTGLGSLGRAAFDVVLASNVLEHFDPEVTAAALGGVFDVLKPGGRLIIVQPNFRYAGAKYFDDYTHRAIFTEVSLPALVRAQGFHVDEVRPRFLPYSLRGSRLPIRPWLVRAYLRSPFKPMAGQMLVVAHRD